MPWSTIRIHAAFFSLLYPLLPTAALAQLSFTNPALSPPPGPSEVGEIVRQARGSCTIAGGSPLTAILPQTNLGVTLAAQPELFAYIPRNNAQYGELQVSEADTERVLLTATLGLPPSVAPGDFQYGPALVSFTLTELDLLPDRLYRWQISLVCDGGDRTSDVAVSGLLLPAGDAYLNELAPEVRAALVDSTAPEPLVQYAAAGLWHETLGQLIDLAEQGPSYSATLAEILTAEGLGAIAGATWVPIQFTPLP